MTVAAQTIELVGALAGVEWVSSRRVCWPRRSRERRSEDARLALGV